MTNLFSQLQQLVSVLENDAKKFYVKGNKSAGTRLRNGMQSVKKIAQNVRMEVSEIKNQE